MRTCGTSLTRALSNLTQVIHTLTVLDLDTAELRRTWEWEIAAAWVHRAGTRQSTRGFGSTSTQWLCTRDHRLESHAEHEIFVNLHTDDNAILTPDPWYPEVARELAA